MGLLKIHYRGQCDTLLDGSYASVCKHFHEWWDAFVSDWITSNVFDILHLKEDETDTIEKMKDFRRDIGIDPEEEISKYDIVRFKTILLIRWMYAEYIPRYKWVFGHSTTIECMNMIEMTMSTAMDAICCIPFMVDDELQFNTPFQTNYGTP